MNTKSVTYCFSKLLSPTTTEQLDIALTSIVFDQQVNLVFLDDGVTLLPEIDAARKSTDFGKSLAGLRMMDEIPVIVEAESLTERNIDAEQIPDFVQFESTNAITDLLRESDLVLYF